MSAVRRHRFVAGVLVASMLGSPAAFAQSPDDAARAQSLFDDAVKLLEANRFAEACPKLAESLALDPAGGTAVDLGFCYEQDGKVASALDAYRAALRIADTEGRDDRKQATNERIVALEKKVGHVHLAVPVDRWQSEEWQVMLDAHALAPDAATAPIAVDRGRHVVTATAPSKRAFVRDFDVTEGATVEIAIAQLEDVSAPVRAPTPAPKAALEPVFVMRDDIPRRNWGIGLGATGLASLGVGVVSGIVAANLHAKSDNLCPAATGCVGDGVDAENQANRAAWVSDVTVVAGVALVGLGTYLFLSAMHAKRVPASNDAALGRVVFDLR